MSGKGESGTADGLVQFARFRTIETDSRTFHWPTCHPSRPTGFCPCDKPFPKALGFYLRATLLSVVLQLPFSEFTIWLLRRMGACIGDNVYFSAGVWIDPLFPDLLTIEDDVLIGSGAKISMHAFGIDEFLAGRVWIRKGAIIGGFSVIGPGVEIGEYATVAGAAAIARDVPARSVAGGNPARAVSRTG